MALSSFDEAQHRLHRLGISIWGSGGSFSNLSSLFIAQKKSIRILFRVSKINKYCPGHTKNALGEKNILSIHNLYFASILSETFLGLHAVPPKPIVNIIQPQLSSRTLTLFTLSKLRLTNHQKNFPYSMFKLWNSFINICFTTDILTQSQLLHWKYGKFKKFVKSALLNFQNLGDLHTWYPFNYNISDLETRILSGDLILNTESISYQLH